MFESPFKNPPTITTRIRHIKHNAQYNTVCRLFYVDGLKLYAESEISLERLLKMTFNFSSDIKMQFGIDKCAKLVAKHGKIQTYDNLVDENVIIQ